MGMFSPETERLRQLLAQQMTHTTGQPAQTQYTLPQMARRMWPEIEQTLWDMSPGVGDYRALDRGAQGYSQALSDMAQGNIGTGLSRLPEATLETISAIPGIGELATAGKGALAALPALATVWHGSPHKFDRFDMSKIGTGEGAQAYGHGLYLADRREVGQSYADALDVGRYDTDAQGMAARALEDSTPESAIRGLEARKAMTHVQGNTEFQDKVDRAIAIIRGGQGAGSNLYRVDLPDEAIANMLDWDAPLGEQPEAVRRALASIGIDNAVMPKHKHGAWFVSINGEIIGKGMDSYDEVLEAIERGWVYGRNDTKLAFSGSAVSGGEIYKAMLNQFGNAKNASERLRELGIPGIKYYDGGSRAAGEGTRNYVVFDDSLPKILERNGEKMR